MRTRYVCIIYILHFLKTLCFFFFFAQYNIFFAETQDKSAKRLEILPGICYNIVGNTIRSKRGQDDEKSRIDPDRSPDAHLPGGMRGKRRAADGNAGSDDAVRERDAFVCRPDGRAKRSDRRNADAGRPDRNDAEYRSGPGRRKNRGTDTSGYRSVQGQL